MHTKKCQPSHDPEVPAENPSLIGASDMKADCASDGVLRQPKKLFGRTPLRIVQIGLGGAVRLLSCGEIRISTPQ